MDKDKAYEDFFRVLRITLNNASVYFKDHPVFIDSIHQLIERLKDLFIHTKNVKVAVAPQSLFVEDKELKDQNFYHDIAVHLHRRKIKTFQITSNVTEAELSEFICNIAKPPQDIEAEESLLSAIFINNGHLNDIIDLLSPEDFYKGAHAKIFTAITELAVKDEPADLVTVANRLNEKDELESVGGAAALAAIADAAPVAVNALSYARIIKGKSSLRQLISASSGIIEQCMKDQGDFE